MTKDDDESAVTIDGTEDRRRRGQAVSLMDDLRAEPLNDQDLEIERRRDRPREADLAG